METFDLISTVLVHAKGQERIFEGMASIFGAPVQTWTPTKIDRGAFSRTLRENGSRVVLLNQHDTTQPIGKPIELRETDTGLYLKGQLSATQLAGDIWVLLTDKVLDGLSIGFDPISTYNEVKNGESWRHITDLNLMEVSVVTFPASAEARISAIHSANGIRHGVQICPNPAQREAQLAELQRIAEGWKADGLPDFHERFGGNWIV